MVTCLVDPPLADAELNALFARAWPQHTDQSFATVLARSLAFIAAESTT
jgi:hypothetical protein